MAHQFAQRTVRSSILQLPPCLRTATLQSRPFSSTSSRKLSVLDIAVAGPEAVLNGIHSLGVPWWATIPLTAVFARGVLGYYVGSKPDRKQVATRTYLSPLINAKADVIRDTKYIEQMNAARESRAGRIGRGLQHFWIEYRARWYASDQIAKPYGAPNITGRKLFNFGILITFAEAIRLKSGCGEGLLHLVLTPVEWIGRIVLPQLFPRPTASDVKDPVEVLAEKLAAQKEAAEVQQPAQSVTSRASEILTGQDVSGTMHANANQLQSLSDNVGPHFDPSMLTEGVGWFQNLGLPDSTGALPTLLALTMLSSAVFQPSTAKAKSAKKGAEDENASTDADKPAAPRALYHESENPVDGVQNEIKSWDYRRRFGIWLSIFFVFAATNMPAAILLYFIPSIAIGWLQNRWLDLKYPLPQPIQKCQRPMRLKSRREWAPR